MDNDRPDLLADFSPITKQEWLDKVTKDLKGRPLADLYWQLEEDVTVSPFAHREDQPEPHEPFSKRSSGNNWEIGEYIEVSDVAAANAQALEALNGGAGALGFKLMHPLSIEQLHQLLEGIDLSIISTNFGEYYSDKRPLVLLDQFIQVALAKGFFLNNLNGSIDFDPILDWNEPPMQDLKKAILRVDQELPGFRMLQINGVYYHAGAEDTTTELAYTIAKASEYLARLDELGISPDLANQYLQFSMAVDKSYFVEIAKLRALKLLWLNVLKAYGVTDAPMPELVVHFAKESQDEQVNTNMIRAATQAMSAVIGGADRLYVLPANVGLKEEPTSFTRRIARNVQHLLKLESHLHRVLDPSAGSYYIEALTEQLATKAWAQFVELEERGAFS